MSAATEAETRECRERSQPTERASRCRSRWWRLPAEQGLQGGQGLGRQCTEAGDEVCEGVRSGWRRRSSALPSADVGSDVASTAGRRLGKPAVVLFPVGVLQRPCRSQSRAIRLFVFPVTPPEQRRSAFAGSLFVSLLRLARRLGKRFGKRGWRPSRGLVAGRVRRFFSPERLLRDDRDGMRSGSSGYRRSGPALPGRQQQAPDRDQAKSAGFGDEGGVCMKA
jgi:hypothetical protein